MKTIPKKALIIIIIAAAAAAAVIIWLFLTRSDYYETHFFHGTYINGWDVSNLTAEEVKSDIQEDLWSYELVIIEKDDNEEIITGEDIGFTYVDDGSIDDLLEAQNGNEWLSHMSTIEEYEITIEYTYEEADVESVVDALSCFDEENIILSQDAYIELSDSEFIIVSEVVGNEPDKEAVYEAVKAALAEEAESIDLEAEGLYILPDVTSEDEELNNTLDSYNLLLSSQITYDFVDSQWVVGFDEIYSWIVEEEDGSYSLDYDSVYQWVYNMAYYTDTFGLSHDFMTSYGVEIKLEAGGDYGWCINKNLTTENLYQYILAGTNAVVEPDYLYTAKDRSSNDIGGTYIEICISTQTMWLYYEGELLVETPVITGNVSTGYSTPSGSVWAIDAKKTDWSFTTFANSHSDYWIPFNGQVGIHDASWQVAFGGSTYLTAGSHGCINTPLEAVKTIYEHVEIGTPVIVYYSTDQVHGPDPTQELIAG